MNKESVDRFSIALAIEIPYPLLYLWYKIAGLTDAKGNTFDYIDLLNGCITNKCFQVN
jgi:hypothetical protein